MTHNYEKSTECLCFEVEKCVYCGQKRSSKEFIDDKCPEASYSSRISPKGGSESVINSLHATQAEKMQLRRLTTNPEISDGQQPKVVEYTNPMIAMGVISPRRTTMASSNLSSISEEDRLSPQKNSQIEGEPTSNQKQSTLETNEEQVEVESSSRGLDKIVEDQEEDRIDGEEKVLEGDTDQVHESSASVDHPEVDHDQNE